MCVCGVAVCVAVSLCGVFGVVLSVGAVCCLLWCCVRGCLCGSYRLFVACGGLLV